MKVSNKIREIMNNIWDSLKMNDEGYSLRKLIAVTIITCVVVGQVAFLKYCFTTENFGMFNEVLIINYGFVATLLGLGAISKFKEKKLDKIPDAEKPE